MHPNRAFHWDDRGEMLAFLRDVSFATVCVDGPLVVHAPVVVAGRDRLRFHVARSHRAAASLDGARALLSCLGPDAYVSPDWYGTPDQVPTWNYLAVEAEGPLRRLDEQELIDLLDALGAEHEARLAPKPAWTRAKLDPRRFEAMLEAIVGFELTIEDLRGTRKLGQNKKAPERSAAAEGLAPFDPVMAELMRPNSSPLEAGGGDPREGWRRGNPSHESPSQHPPLPQASPGSPPRQRSGRN